MLLKVGNVFYLNTEWSLHHGSFYYVSVTAYRQTNFKILVSDR